MSEFDVALPPDELLVAMGFPAGTRFITSDWLGPCRGCYEDTLYIAETPSGVRINVYREGVLSICDDKVDRYTKLYADMGVYLEKVGQIPCKLYGHHEFFRVTKQGPPKP